MGLVECRICHVKINKEKETDWIMPSKGWYYHKSCYETWKANPSDEDWHAMIYDFLARDLKVKYDFHICEGQIKKFQRENKINPKGIYFTLKYFYEIKGNPWADDKTHGSIGIVPFVFTEARNYWIEQEQKRRGFMKSMETEAKEKHVIYLTRKRRPIEKYNLDDIGGEE